MPHTSSALRSHTQLTWSPSAREAATTKRIKIVGYSALRDLFLTATIKSSCTSTFLHPHHAQCCTYLQLRTYVLSLLAQCLHAKQPSQTKQELSVTPSFVISPHYHHQTFVHTHHFFSKPCTVWLISASTNVQNRPTCSTFAREPAATNGTTIVYYSAICDLPLNASNKLSRTVTSSFLHRT